MAMVRREAFDVLAGLQGEALVVTHFGPTRPEWYDASGGRQTFFMHGGMGMASSVGLGLALGLPHRRVWALEGDGALQLNLGSLITLAQTQPPNYTLFILGNRTYEAVGNQPIVGGDTVDFRALAEAAGIGDVHAFETLGDFREGIGPVLESDVFSVVVLELDGQSRFSRKMPWDPIEAKYRFGREIEDTEGIAIFRQ